jgi:hypothetical protein
MKNSIVNNNDKINFKNKLNINKCKFFKVENPNP